MGCNEIVCMGVCVGNGVMGEVIIRLPVVVNGGEIWQLSNIVYICINKSKDDKGTNSKRNRGNG